MVYCWPFGFQWERNGCHLVQAQTSPRNLSFSSHADITPSTISRSNSLGGNLDSPPSAHHNWPHSLQEHLSGSTLTSTVDKDQSISACTYGSSNSRISERSPTVSRALQELMLSEDEVSHAFSSNFILPHYGVESLYERIHARPLYLCLQLVVFTKAARQSHIRICIVFILLVS